MHFRLYCVEVGDAFTKKITAVGIFSGLKNYETQKSGTEIPFREVATNGGNPGAGVGVPGVSLSTRVS